jgi:hypothetical protein
MTRIWIGSLPVTFTANNLADLFTKNGFKNVKNAEIVYPKAAYGFVEIKSTDVEKAINNIPNSVASDPNLNKIKIEIARTPDTESVDPSMTRIWIGKLPVNFKTDGLLTLFNNKNFNFSATMPEIVYLRNAYGFVEINDSDVPHAINDLPKIFINDPNLHKIKIEVARTLSIEPSALSKKK